MLQKMLEIMKNEELMNEAAEQTDSLIRMVYVAAFWITQYCGTESR
jgi:hypothetical protein